MAVMKVIEIMASSKKSWEDAALAASKRTGKTVKNIKSIWIQDQSIALNKNGSVKEYRVTCKISFEVGD